MRGNELLDKMALIDPAYVEAADAAPKIRKIGRFRWSAVAACLCILLGATTVLAVTGLGTRLIRFFKSGEESGYELAAEIEKIPAEELKGEIREVPALIKEQFENYQPYMSQAPGYWEKDFETRDAACDYVGCSRLMRLQWEAKEEQTMLHVQGLESGDLTEVSVETWYDAGDVRMQLFSRIFTENLKDEITFFAATTEDVDFTESFHTTKSGRTVQVIEMSELASGYKSLDGYLVDNGVLYELSVIYQEKDAEQAKALLEQWAELY